MIITLLIRESILLNRKTSEIEATIEEKTKLIDFKKYIKSLFNIKKKDQIIIVNNYIITENNDYTLEEIGLKDNDMIKINMKNMNFENLYLYSKNYFLNLKKIIK
jgi:hypothetical protein